MQRRVGQLTAGAVVALTAVVATSGPAQAVAPSTVASGTPSWSVGTLRASGTFVPLAAGTYFSTQILYRTTTSRAPVCTINGCASTSTAQVGLTAYGTITTIAAQNRRAVSLQVVSANCAASATTRYYWNWTKVSDSSGNVKWTLSRSLAGKYC